MSEQVNEQISFEKKKSHFKDTGFNGCSDMLGEYCFRVFFCHYLGVWYDNILSTELAHEGNHKSCKTFVD